MLKTIVVLLGLFGCQLIAMDIKSMIEINDIHKLGFFESCFVAYSLAKNNTLRYGYVANYVNNSEYSGYRIIRLINQEEEPMTYIVTAKFLENKAIFVRKIVQHEKKALLRQINEEKFKFDWYTFNGSYNFLSSYNVSK